MPLDKCCWITAAESCQIWDYNFEPIHKFDEGHVLDVACNQDGSNLAFIKRNNNQIVTASVGNQVFQGITNLTEGDATALGYSNELLLAGTNSGNVFLWDYTKHKMIRKYEGSDRTAVCRIQSNGSIIAAGHNGGIIQLYGIKTGQAIDQYSVVNSSGLRDLKISSVKNSLMAAAFNSGSVAAWNTHSKGNSSLVVEFTGAHQSPVTTVALSPITDILMVSGGLDKNIILYDCPKKKILKKIEVDSPVSAIEFFPDGTSLVVGTSRGKILVYDLRSINTPVQTILAHSTSISKLICRVCSYSQIKVESSNSRRTFNLPIPSKSEPLALPVPSPANELPEKLPRFHFLSSTTSDGHPVSTPIDTGDPNNIKEFPPLGFVSTNHDIEHKNSSLFSPVRGENSVDVFSSPSLAASPPSLKFKQQDCKEVREPPRNEILLSLADETETPFSASSTMFSPPKDSAIVVADNCKETQQAPTEATVDFQADFIRRIVHDVEDNLREVLRCRFGDLIIQSAQQFLTLQNELEELRRQIQDKASLEEEVKRLRQEVNQLRNLY